RIGDGLLMLLLLSMGGTWASSEPLRPRCHPTRVLQSVMPPLPQAVCNYRDVRFESIRLSGCRRGVNPVVSYAVALSCQCGLCRRSTTDCGGPKDHPWTCDDPRFQDSSSSKAPPPSLPSPSRLPEP
uniref:Glycoprotein hormone subunit beta domain-containing protein n=1 Tax=Nomascus leucogenys TaxID=61853 RepID=A0A2I3HQE4_NOMLE